MKTEHPSPRQTAKTAGWLFFVYSLLILYNLVYVQPRTVVSDTAATAKNILDNEFLFRSGISLAFIAHAVFVMLVLFLYRLLKDVNVHRAKIMVGLILVAVPVALLADVLKLTALSIFKGEVLTSVPIKEKQDVAVLLMRLAAYASRTITLYWGLWLVSLGVLVQRSGFFPKWIGIVLIVNGAAYIIGSISFILLPAQASILFKILFPACGIGQISFTLWLILFGVREHLSIHVVSERETSLQFESS